MESTQEATESGWQALIDEDRLLSKLEVLQNQLQVYTKVRPHLQHCDEIQQQAYKLLMLCLVLRESLQYNNVDLVCFRIRVKTRCGSN